jgi:hypothetical protein
MDKQFEQFLDGFVTQYKTAVFNNIKTCKSLLLDHAKGEFNKEIRLLLQALELGCHTAILNSNDLNLTRMSLIKRLQDEYFISEETTASLIDLLLLVLKGCKNKAPVTALEQPEKVTKLHAAQNISTSTTLHDYEKEAKAEKLYHTAINCFFKEVGNNFTLAIESLLKAIKICPNDPRFHYYLCFCLYKVNDTNLLLNETKTLRALNYDESIGKSVAEDIGSSRKGKIAKRLYANFCRGGKSQLNYIIVNLFNTSRISHHDCHKIFDVYMDFMEWAKTIDKNIVQP